jgi:DNA-binding response OmpR family regulator
MPRILVVDDDPSMRSAIAAELSRPQREIAVAADGEEALTLADSFGPDLVLTDILMPRLDGWGLVTALRARRETSLTAVIFLTALDSAAARVYGLRLGAVDFLGKPFDLDELELRVENALHYSVRARRAAASLADGVAGSLAHIGLATLLTMLSLERKSGELLLTLGDDEASLLLRDGSVVSASFAHRRDLHGARCVCEILRWDAGRFSFAEHAVTVKDEVGMPTTALLMEGARLFDEAVQRTAGAT